MYITDIHIGDLVNFQGDHKVSFSVTEKSIPNDLYVLVGQNNSGKSSLLQLARACTDTDYLKKEWKNINLSKKKPPGEQPSKEQPSGEQPSEEQSQAEEQPHGIVMCTMKDSAGKDIYAAFYKTQHSGVYAWAKPDEKNVLRFAFMKLTNDETVYSVEKKPKDEGLPVSRPTVDYITKKIKAALETQWKTEEELGSNPLPWEGMIKPLVIQSDSQSIKESVIEDWLELKPDVRNEVMDFIRRIGYAHYKVHISEGDMVFTDKNTGLEFYIDKLPDGHQYLWSMAIKMSLCCQRGTNTTKCLIVDEPTRSMHPSLVHHLSAEMQHYCQKHELQFIICSHSPALVRALRLSNVFLATRMQDGTTTIRTLIDGESSETAKQNVKFVVDQKMEDILFARMVMIVEGETDKRLFSMLLSRLSRLKEDDFCEVLRQHVSTTAEFRSLLRDIIVVAAGGKNLVPDIMKHLDFLGIPFFMVVDGDLVFQTRSSAIVSVNKLMKTTLMHNLFKGSDMLRDEILLKELKTLFQGLAQCGPMMYLGDVMTLHDIHKEGNCKCEKSVCLETTDNRVVLKAGCRSLARTCLECVVECTFAIKLAEKETQQLTDEELEKLVETKRKERVNEEWENLPNTEKTALNVKERETLTEGEDEERGRAKRKWIEKKLTEEEGKDLIDEERKRMENEEWQTLVKKDRESWTQKDRRIGSTILFRRYTPLLQRWFRLFIWRNEEPFDLESVVRPFICKIEQLKKTNNAPGAMYGKDLEQLRSSYYKMKDLVKKMERDSHSATKSFREDIKLEMNSHTMIDRNRKEWLYFGLTGLTYSEMTTLVDKLVQGVITEKSFVKEFTECGTKIGKRLKKKLCYGFTATELTTLVDEMIQGIKNNITPDLRDFLVFLDLRILPYYAHHEKVRKLKLIDSNINIKLPDAQNLKVECVLEDEGDERALQNVEPSVST